MVGGALALLGLTGAPAPVAEACGGFFSRASLEAGRRPSLAYEQSLIVFDEAKQREHFVREVAFRRTSEPFGFVVPTPSRPEVAKVAASPFGRLRSAFAFEEPGEGLGFGGGIGRLGGGGAPGRGVTVLDVKRVGSFTAFVLAADDEAALGTWLGENGFVTSKEAEPWLRHYVTRRFFFVAMRYEPPAGGAPATSEPRRAPDPLADTPATPPPSASTTSETIRISFDTPLPYYPYFEPDRPAGTDGGDGRLLEVWLVTRGLHAPVAARRTADGATTWGRPMAEGRRYAPATRTTLEDALDAEKGLLGAGDLTVQRFMDQKTSRQGWGDVVFVPRSPTTGDAAHRARLRRLVSTLDPTLPPAPVGGAK